MPVTLPAEDEGDRHIIACRKDRTQENKYIILFLRGNFSAREANDWINAFEEGYVQRIQDYFEFHDEFISSVGVCTVFQTELPQILDYFWRHYFRIGCAQALCWVDKYTYFLRMHIAMQYQRCVCRIGLFQRSVQALPGRAQVGQRSVQALPGSASHALNVYIRFAVADRVHKNNNSTFQHEQERSAKTNS